MGHLQIIKAIILQDLKRHILQIKVNDNAYLILEPHVLCNNVGKTSKILPFYTHGQPLFQYIQGQLYLQQNVFRTNKCNLFEAECFSSICQLPGNDSYQFKKHFCEKYRPEAFHNLLGNKKQRALCWLQTPVIIYFNSTRKKQYEEIQNLTFLFP